MRASVPTSRSADTAWSRVRMATSFAWRLAFAGELDRRGIAKGERVMLWGENSAEWVAAFFGCTLRGVVVVPMDDGASADFAARVFRQVQAKLLVSSRQHASHCSATQSCRDFRRPPEPAGVATRRSSENRIAARIPCRSSSPRAPPPSRAGWSSPTATCCRISLPSSARCRAI